MVFMRTLNERIGVLYASRWFNHAAFGLIAVMVLIAYSNTFTATFHFDDTPAIVDNASIKHVTWENIKNCLSANRPVVMLSLMLNYQLSGLNVVGWHIFNITNHIANCCLVYVLILWTLNLPALASRYIDKSKRMSLFGALLFAVHPIQTESVTYVITRTETMASFFYLAALLLFVKGARTNNFRYFIAAAFSSLCSMESKEWAVTLPATIFLYDYLFLAEGKLKPALSRWKSYILVALPWAVILPKVPIFSSGGGASVGFGMTSTTGITPLTYLMTSFNVMWTYLRVLVLPINQNLDYDYPVAKTLMEFPTLLSFMAHIAVIVLMFWLYRKKGLLLVPFGVAWFYLTLSPVQSFVPIIDVIFEHRMYLPSIGIFIAFVAGYESLFDWWGKKPASINKASQ